MDGDAGIAVAPQTQTRDVSGSGVEVEETDGGASGAEETTGRYAVFPAGLMSVTLTPICSTGARADASDAAPAPSPGPAPAALPSPEAPVPACPVDVQGVPVLTPQVRAELWDVVRLETELTNARAFRLDALARFLVEHEGRGAADAEMDMGKERTAPANTAAAAGALPHLPGCPGFLARRLASKAAAEHFLDGIGAVMAHFTARAPAPPPAPPPPPPGHVVRAGTAAQEGDSEVLRRIKKRAMVARGRDAAGSMESLGREVARRARAVRRRWGQLGEGDEDGAGGGVRAGGEDAGAPLVFPLKVNGEGKGTGGDGEGGGLEAAFKKAGASPVQGGDDACRVGVICSLLARHGLSACVLGRLPPRTPRTLLVLMSPRSPRKPRCWRSSARRRPRSPPRPAHAAVPRSTSGRPSATPATTPAPLVALPLSLPAPSLRRLLPWPLLPSLPLALLPSILCPLGFLPHPLLPLMPLSLLLLSLLLPHVPLPPPFLLLPLPSVPPHLPFLQPLPSPLPRLSPPQRLSLP